MKIPTNQKFLAIYSGVLTIAFAVTIFSGFTTSRAKSSFDEITVHRINVVEPDGTVRLIISDKAEFPGMIIKNKQVDSRPDRRTAGMLFFNDEGTENGGLIFGGNKEPNGTETSYGHLSFDRYAQDQVMTIEADQEGARRRSGISIDDRPDWPITDLVNLPRSQWMKFAKSHEMGHQRIYLGRTPDKAASLTLKDVQGHPRIVIRVAANGTPSLQFLDANGKVVSELPKQTSESNQ